MLLGISFVPLSLRGFCIFSQLQATGGRSTSTHRTSTLQHFFNIPSKNHSILE
jgi:hypothetical protein